MSHKDYTKYSNNNRFENASVESKVVEETPIVESVVEPIVTDETPVVKPTVDVVTETNVDDEEPKAVTSGVVADCAKLNVRENPRKDAAVVCTIDKGTVVEISMSESTEDFYKVYTEFGATGYCMKNFITLK